MLISVIIPFYNSEKTIKNAIESVLSQSQIDDLEIICVNDGSTDSTAKIVAQYQNTATRFPISCINQVNKGVASARNTGIKLAKGKYIALLDADDTWYHNKTKILIDKLHEFSLDFIACRRHPQPLLFPYKVNKLGYAAVSFRQLLFRNEIQPSTVIFRKNILEKTGLFVEGQRYAEDHYLWLIISRYFKIGIWNQQLILAGNGKKSFGESGLSANLKAMRKGFEQNLINLERNKIISKTERVLYSFFYYLKYLFLLLRKNFSQI